MDPLIGAGLIGAGSGLIDTIGNLFISKKNRESQEATQRTTWAREDNAVQRRAADMDAAGINPVLAAGSPAQAGPTVAPKNDYKMDSQEKALATMAMMTQKAQIEKTQAETDRINTETDFMKKEKPLDINKKELENWMLEGTKYPRRNMVLIEEEITRAREEKLQNEVWMSYEDKLIKEIEVQAIKLNLNQKQIELAKMKLELAIRRGDKKIWNMLGLPTTTKLDKYGQAGVMSMTQYGRIGKKAYEGITNRYKEQGR